MDLWTDENIMSMVTVAFGALMFFARLLWRDRISKYESTFSKGVEVAYFLVENLSKHTETKIDDKAAVALKALRDFMGTEGMPLKQADEEKAKLLFQAMHGKGR